MIDDINLIDNLERKLFQARIEEEKMIRRLEGVAVDDAWCRGALKISVRNDWLERMLKLSRRGKYLEEMFEDLLRQPADLDKTYSQLVKKWNQYTESSVGKTIKEEV
tara:strand:+ start:267 stop:587 length:321 start_codon:yes stop_codon:yes gene_type:complete